MQRSALCRSRRELSNEYLLAKFGFDTAENEPDLRFENFSTTQGFNFYYFPYVSHPQIGVGRPEERQRLAGWMAGVDRSVPRTPFRFHSPAARALLSDAA